MIGIPGNKTVIVDSDALIGLIHQEDILHKRCLKISDYLEQGNFSIIIPYPIVLEAATTLARAIKVARPDLAQQLLADYTQVSQPPIDEIGVPELVVSLYNPKTSKKNTPFDHYLLALAKKNEIEVVFSFDSFYQKQGLILIEDLMK